MAASAEKSQTVEPFCSASSSSLDGVCWQERARQLVAEVPGDDTALQRHLTLFSCLANSQRSARPSSLSSGSGSLCSARSSRDLQRASCSRRSPSLLGFSFPTGHCRTTLSSLSTTSQVFTREQLGRGHCRRPDSWLPPNDPGLVSLHYLNILGKGIIRLIIQSQDYYPYMSAGPPSALEHVWKRDLIFSPESRDDEGRRVVVLRLGQWPPSEVAQIPQYFLILSQLFPLISQCFL